MTARTLILVRHGKAQSRELGIPDEQRTLTKAGRQALRAWLPKAARLAKPTLKGAGCREAVGAVAAAKDAVSDAGAGARAGGVQIWASPTARTRQTAKEVARAFGKAAGRKIPIEKHESLHAQDLAAFCAELEETSAACVVAVGHNPFMEEALALLCGARVEFATGAVAAVGLPRSLESRMAGKAEAGSMPAFSQAEKAPAVAESSFAQVGVPSGQVVAPSGHSERSFERARLLWFVQGPRSQRWRVRGEIESTVRAWDDTVEERLAAFLEAPDDVEALHKLRVSIRTLRSLLAFAAPFLDRKRHKALQRDLRSVVAETSRLREFDVLLKQTVELPLATGDLADAVRSMRKTERDCVVKALSGDAARQALDRVRESVKRMPWTDVAAKWGIGPEEACARFDEMAHGVRDGFATVDFADAEAVHTLRKNAKRVRYAAENFEGLLGTGAVAEARRMVDVQDLLGAVCDARVNVGIVCEFPTEGLSLEARRALGMLLERNMAFEEEFLREMGAEAEGEDGAETPSEE